VNDHSAAVPPERKITGRFDERSCRLSDEKACRLWLNTALSKVKQVIGQPAA
jgi:hypothetical protein